MIIDVVAKNENTYYILNFKDVDGVWRKAFITKKVAEALTSVNVKIRNKKNESKND